MIHIKNIFHIKWQFWEKQHKLQFLRKNNIFHHFYKTYVVKRLGRGDGDALFVKLQKQFLREQYYFWGVNFFEGNNLAIWFAILDLTKSGNFWQEKLFQLFPFIGGKTYAVNFSLIFVKLQKKI